MIKLMLLVFSMMLCLSGNIYADANNKQDLTEASINAVYGRVSITPWPKSAFTDAPDLHSVLVQGSWIGDEGGNFIYGKTPEVNTSEIFCDKNTNKCVEARAEVLPDGFLTAKSWEYKVIKWADDEVVANQASVPYSFAGHSIGAGKLTLHIDRINKITTLKGEYETDGQKGVWNAHLDSGEVLMKLYKSKK